MKRTNVIILALLMVCASFTSCVRKSERMSFEQIMQLKHIQMSTEWEIFENLEDSESYFKRFGYSLISGTVTDVSYYAVWKDDETAMDGYSVVEFRVDQVDEENNDLHLNPNDTVTIQDMNYISFRRRMDLDKYASENAERVIVGDGVKTIELIPETGGNYSRITCETCPPMKIGERYTLMYVESSPTGRYWGEYALPVDSGFLKDCTEKYGYIYPEDILSIAREIQAKFGQ